VLERVVILQPRALGVERRVEIRERNLARILAFELRQLEQAGQPVKRIAANQEVVLGAAACRCNGPDRAGVIQQPDLGHPIVGWE
jgi:hypothetical protein